MPWSWGRGVRVSTEDRQPREVRVADVQEKVGGTPGSQAQGAEQVRFWGRPHRRVPGRGRWGVQVRAGEWGWN